MNKMTEETSNKFVLVSFLMSILIIYVHAGNLVSYDIDTELYDALFTVQQVISSSARSIAIPMFFMMSGYKFFRFDINSDNWGEIIKGKLKSRIRTVLIPYILWTLLMYLFYIAITRIEPIANIMNTSEIVEISLNELILSVITYKYIFTFWFMRDLLVILAITPILGEILRKKYLSIVFIIVLIVISIFNIDFMIFDRTSLLFFFEGSFLSSYGRNFVEKRYSKKLNVISLILFIPCYIASRHGIAIVSELFGLLCPILIWIILDTVCRKANMKWFYKQNFFIYAIHIIPLSVITKLLARIGNGTSVWIMLAFFTAPIITLCVVWFISKILYTYVPKIYGVLCGNRG